MNKELEKAYDIKRNAVKYKMEVNADEKKVNFILNKLEKINDRYGRPYCPCLPAHTDDTVCPCRNMRQFNACRCGLYMKE